MSKSAVARVVSPRILSCLLLCTPAIAGAGQLVQTGSLSGAGAPMTQPLVLDAFDTQGGTLLLTSVTLDALTAIGGGYQTDGSGISVDVDAFLTAEYSIGGTLIVATQALLDLTVPNNGPPVAVSVFDNDIQQAVITDPAELAPFIGAGTITLDVFTEMSITETPAGVIFFGAGGTVQYTLTYEFEPAPPGEMFRRGDTNGDGTFNIADPISALASLFGPGPAFACSDAADANDDGSLNIADAVFALAALFTNGPDPTDPYSICGLDPTDDTLDCGDFPPCP